ncbi:MAG: prolipoprotein diacylglyceryl transferase [Acidimicrobiia bacterium]|nr:prolipoprotein diacylglyceryl transferase [Acidimicrobiia bacterium]
MYPRLITTPFYTLHTFGVLLAAAYLTALWWLVRTGRREGYHPDALTSLGFWAIVGAIVGAKALMVVRNASDYLAHPGELLSASFLTSAGDFYGGFIGGVVGALLFFVLNRSLSFWPLADLCAPAIALGQGIGRIGCLMAGDDYGSPTSLPWAVTFTDPDAAAIGGAPLNVPLHPVQLYESLFCLALFGVLVRLARRKTFDGQILIAYSVMYAIGRFLIEYLRGDIDRGFVFGTLFSTSQFIAIVVFILAIAVLPGRRHAGVRPAPVAATPSRPSGRRR